MADGMSKEQFRRRVMEVLSEEMACEERWYYLSFASDRGFLGAVIIRAHGITDAMMRCNARGINPGGEIRAMPIPDDAPLPTEHCNKLLSLADLEAIFGPTGLVHADGSGADRVCSTCSEGRKDE